jgi:hypothetical protein
MDNEITYIHAGWLIDGSGAAAQHNMRIGLQNGSIRSIRNMTGPMPLNPVGRYGIFNFYGLLESA